MKQNCRESNTMQEPLGPNDTAQLRAENQRVSEVEAAPGGALAAAPCSAGGSTYQSEVFSKIAEFTGHEVKDFEGGWISECRSIIILPSNKIKTAYHMQAQEKWEVVAETDRLIVLKSCY